MYQYTCSICFWIDNLDIKTENHHEKAATNNERNSLLMIKKKLSTVLEISKQETLSKFDK
ncbi:hypothetical protein DERF_007683 [Dermatophagoides farinae]|uniref:Uncharacterized protein n=1 Tax=Dermatophagoides farinae TaxID=6954 RepID=A0A922HYP9_DERFA|nr:hypothetical protein DERF_007683 [Dermatophagoides farinae]